MRSPTRFPTATTLALAVLALCVLACSDGGGGGGPTGPGGPILTLTTADSVVPTGGSTAVTARVREGGGDAVSGVTVAFSVDRGFVEDLSLVTGSDGTAATVFRGTQEGTATLTAQLSDGATAPAMVEVDGGLVVTLAAGATAIPAGGSTGLVARVRRVDGTVAEAGIPVDLSTNVGHLDTTRPLTDDFGTATTVLRGDGEVGTAIITASARGGAVTSLEIGVGQGFVLELAADPDDIDGDETSTVRARVRDAGGAPTPGIVVAFTTSHGELSDDDATSGDDGVAAVVLDPAGDVGIAVVTAEVVGTGFRRSVEVVLRD